jgi:ankyrin repeat protein
MHQDKEIWMLLNTLNLKGLTWSIRIFKIEIFSMCKPSYHNFLLVSAASNGEIGILKYLISKGCKVDVPTKLGRSPLSKACWNGRIDVVDILL